MLAQHLGDALGAVEAGVRPENARLRPLLELAVDGVRVGMRVQEEAVLARELDHAPRHRQVHIGAVDVVFADSSVFVF